MIHGSKDFAEYANKIINGIFCLYLAENEIMAEPQDIETSLKIPRTLKVYKVLRTYNEDNVCKMEVFKLADETDPFHIQWYHREGDPEVCGHNQLPLSYEIDQTCGYRKERTKEMKSGSSVNCATSGFMKLVWKSNQYLSRSFSLFCSKVFMFI